MNSSKSSYDFLLSRLVKLFPENEKLVRFYLHHLEVCKETNTSILFKMFSIIAENKNIEIYRLKTILWKDFNLYVSLNSEEFKKSLWLLEDIGLIKIEPGVEGPIKVDYESSYEIY